MDLAALRRHRETIVTREHLLDSEIKSTAAAVAEILRRHAVAVGNIAGFPITHQRLEASVDDFEIDLRQLSSNQAEWLLEARHDVEDEISIRERETLSRLVMAV